MTNKRSHRRSSAFIVALVFLVISLPFSGIGLWFGLSSWSLLSVAKQADGQVIRMVQNHRGSVAPVVEFQIDGERHEFQTWLSTSPPRFSVGDKVTVMYDPRNSKSVSIASFVDLWLFPLIFGGIGVVMMTVAVAIVVTKWLGDAIDPDVRQSSGRGSDLDESRMPSL